MVDLRTISFPIYTHLSDLSLHRKTNKDIVTANIKIILTMNTKNKDTQGNTTNILTMKTKIKAL